MFNYEEGEIFGCVADIGWITGHTYVVYGPLSNGATTLLFESTPMYPNPGRYWEMVERLRLDHIYLAPTALRMLLKAGDSWVKKYDRSSLKKLGCGKTFFTLLSLFKPVCFSIRFDKFSQEGPLYILGGHRLYLKKVYFYL